MVRTRERNFTILIGLCVLQIVYYWPLMSERMVSHFDGAGNPNGWSSRSTFFCLYAGLTVMIIFMFRFPASLISMPNREY